MKKEELMWDENETLREHLTKLRISYEAKWLKQLGEWEDDNWDKKCLG